MLLSAVEAALEHLLGLRRQVVEDLVLRSSEEERTHRAHEDAARLVVELRRAPLRTQALPEARALERSGVQELEQAAELAQVVLDGRAGARAPLARLVEHDQGELHLGQGGDVAPQRAVRRQHDVRVLGRLEGVRAVRARVVDDAECRREALGLCAPVEHQ